MSTSTTPGVLFKAVAIRWENSASFLRSGPLTKNATSLLVKPPPAIAATCDTLVRSG